MEGDFDDCRKDLDSGVVDTIVSNDGGNNSNTMDRILYDEFRTTFANILEVKGRAKTSNSNEQFQKSDCTVIDYTLVWYEFNRYVIDLDNFIYRRKYHQQRESWMNSIGNKKTKTFHSKFLADIQYVLSTIVSYYCNVPDALLRLKMLPLLQQLKTEPIQYILLLAIPQIFDLTLSEIDKSSNITDNDDTVDNNNWSYSDSHRLLETNIESEFLDELKHPQSSHTNQQTRKVSLAISIITSLPPLNKSIHIFEKGDNNNNNCTSQPVSLMIEDVIVAILDSFIVQLGVKYDDEIAQSILNYVVQEIPAVSTDTFPILVRILFSLLQCDRDDGHSFITGICANNNDYVASSMDDHDDIQPLSITIITKLRQELQRRCELQTHNCLQFGQSIQMKSTFYCISVAVTVTSLNSQRTKMFLEHYLQTVQQEFNAVKQHVHERVTNDSKTLWNTLQPIDLVVLLLMQSINVDWKYSIQRMMHSWLSAKMFPFDSLTELVAVLTKNQDLIQSLTDSNDQLETYLHENDSFDELDQTMISTLIQLSFFLLLSPARVDYSNDTIRIRNDTLIHNFIQVLYEHIDNVQKTELVLGIFHVNEQSSPIRANWKTSPISSLPRCFDDAAGKTSQRTSQTANESFGLFTKTNTNKVKKKPSQVIVNLDAQPFVHQSTNSILYKLVKRFTDEMIQYKMHFIEILNPTDVDWFVGTNKTQQQQPRYGRSDNSIHDICLVLVEFCEYSHPKEDGIDIGNDNGHLHLKRSELITLIHSMLFTSSRRCWIRDKMSVAVDPIVIRGIQFAMILIQSECFQINEKKVLQRWILQLTQPTITAAPSSKKASTKTLVQPEIGIECLQFLKLWCELGLGTQDDFFTCIQEMLSVSGLVQKKEDIQHHMDTNRAVTMFSNITASATILQSPQTTKKTSPNNKQSRSSSEFAFCIDYFLQHLSNDIYYHPSQRWIDCTQWVYELVNTYLQLGSKKPKPWKPYRWLQAVVILPTIDTPTVDLSNTDKAAFRWLKENLCREDQQNGFNSSYQMNVYSSSSSSSDMLDVVDTISNLGIHQIRSLNQSLYRYRLALFIATTLSAAVLQNSYKCYLEQQQQQQQQQPTVQSTNMLNFFWNLIKLQLTKIFHLQNNGNFVDTFLKQLANTIRRRRVKLSRNTVADDPSIYSDYSVLERMTSKVTTKEHDELVSSLVFANNCIANVNTNVFYNTEFISTNVLWGCLMDSSSSGSSSSTSSSLSSYRNDILTYTSYLEEIDLRQINDQYERIVLMLQIRCSITQHLTVLVTDGISQTNNHNHDDDDELVNRYGIDQKHCMLCVNETFQLLEMLPKIHSIADHFSSVGNEDPADVYLRMNELVISSLRLLTSIVLLYNRRQCRTAINAKTLTTPTSSNYNNNDFNTFLQWCNDCFATTIQVSKESDNNNNNNNRKKILTSTTGNNIFTTSNGPSQVTVSTNRSLLFFETLASYIQTYNETNPTIVKHMFEIISILAIQEEQTATNQCDELLLKHTIELSWMSLQNNFNVCKYPILFGNQYTDNDDDIVFPYAFLQVAHKFPIIDKTDSNSSTTTATATTTSSRKNHKNRKTPTCFRYLRNEKFSNITCSQTKYELIWLRHGLLRHWGLLSFSRNNFSLLVNHVTTFLDELWNCFNTIHCQKNSSYHTKTSDDNVVRSNLFRPYKKRKRKQQHQQFHDDDDDDDDSCSTIAFLNEHTAMYVFEWLLELIYASLVLFEPSSTAGGTVTEHCKQHVGGINKIKLRCGPYNELDQLLRLYKKILDMYTKYVVLFSKPTTFKIFLSCKEIVTTIIDVLYRCMDWRSIQPMLPITERSKQTTATTIIDIGDIRFIKNVIDTITGTVIQSIRSICDIWDDSESNNTKYSTSLRMSVEIVEATMNEILDSYNITEETVASTYDDSLLFQSKVLLFQEKNKSESQDKKGIDNNFQHDKHNVNDGDNNYDNDDDDDDDSAFGIYGGEWGT